MLTFDATWRFETPPDGEIPHEAVNEFSSLINRIAAQRDHWRTLEHFKDYFAGAAGTTSTQSSSSSWAEYDLGNYMRQAAVNAPMFIEAFYDGCESLTCAGTVAVPTVQQMNRVLARHGVLWEIRPPDLVHLSDVPAEPIAVPERAPSLNEQAQELIQKSLSQSQQLLSERRHRQAVQELLWLLETLSTSFQGIDTEAGTVQGKYFNKIIEDLRRRSPGTTLEQAITWITTLHGYLSSPRGGGIRHGSHVQRGDAMTEAEGHLFCNLIRSYISYLLAEHQRLTGRK